MMNLLLSYLVAKIDIEIQSGLEPGSSKWREIPPCFDFYVVLCSYSSRPFYALLIDIYHLRILCSNGRAQGNTLAQCNISKTMRPSQDLNLGLLNGGQMLLLTEPLELWHWS